MKTLAAMTIVAGMAMSACGQADVTNLVYYEAAVIDDASGQMLASAGPWMWEEQIDQILVGNIEGTSRSIVVQCRDDVGRIYEASLDGVDLLAPVLPGELASLSFIPNGYKLSVIMNGEYYIGEISLFSDTMDVDIDIIPFSNVNLFNVKSNMKMPVAVLGSADLDVKLIDVASLKLATVAPVCFFKFDIQRDGYQDLVLLFQDKSVAALVPDGVNGEVVGLELTGTLKDGTKIKGTDDIKLVVPPPPKPCRWGNNWNDNRGNGHCNDRDNNKNDSKDCGKGRK